MDENKFLGFTAGAGCLILLLHLAFWSVVLWGIIKIVQHVTA